MDDLKHGSANLHGIDAALNYRLFIGISSAGHIDCFAEMVLNFHILATVSFLHAAHQGLTRITSQPRSHQLQQLCPDHTGLEAPYLGVWNMGGHKYAWKLHYEYFWIKHLFIFCLQKVSWFLFLFCWRECLCLALVWNMGGQLGTNMLPIECN